MKIVDKICKIDENISIRLLDNGFLFEASGKNGIDDWKNVKIACTTKAELDALINEALELDRSE